MSILSLLDGLSVEEVGKLVLGERNQLIQNKMQELLDSLLESEICEFFEDATNATEGNFRNGYYSRTINTAYGPLALKMPRDRLNQFKTNLLKPYQRTTDSITEMIQRLYVHGMTEKEIVDHLLEEFGLSLSKVRSRRNASWWPLVSQKKEKRSFLASISCQMRVPELGMMS